MNPIPEPAEKFDMKTASIQIFTFKMSKNSTVIGHFIQGCWFYPFQALALA